MVEREVRVVEGVVGALVGLDPGRGLRLQRGEHGRTGVAGDVGVGEDFGAGLWRDISGGRGV